MSVLLKYSLLYKPTDKDLLVFLQSSSFHLTQACVTLVDGFHISCLSFIVIPYSVSFLNDSVT